MNSTIRIGGFKLVRNYDYIHNQKTSDQLELYQLYETHDGKAQRVDIEGSNNLAAKIPEKARALNAKLSEMLTAMNASYPYYSHLGRIKGQCRPDRSR